MAHESFKANFHFLVDVSIFSKRRGATLKEGMRVVGGVCGTHS
jgi:hypothetical protein